MDQENQHPDDETAKREQLAAVLHRLFTQFRRGGSQSKSVEQIWREILQTGPGNGPFFSALSSIESAITKIEWQIDNLPKNKFRNIQESSPNLIRNLRNTISIGVLPRSGDFAQNTITPDLLQNLANISDVLALFHSDLTPNEGIITSMLSKLDALQVAIEEANFPDRVKFDLLNRLGSLHWAITNWHLLGSDSLIEPLGSLGAAISYARSEAPAETDAEKSIVKKITSGFGELMSLIGKYKTAKGAVEDIWQIAKDLGITRLL